MSAAAGIIPHGENASALFISPIVEDQRTLKDVLQECGWVFHAATSLESAATLLRKRVASVVITERELGSGTWKDVLNLIDGLTDPPQLVVTSDDADEHLWAEALNLGAYDVLTKPFDPAEVSRVVRSAWMRHHATVNSRSLRSSPSPQLSRSITARPG